MSRAFWTDSVVRGALPICATVLLLYATLGHADQTDAQTGTAGTETADVIGVSAPLDVTASLDTDAGEALDATATGVDALGGDDAVSADAAIATDATATAVITSDPKETTAKATAVAVKGGEGADAVTVNDATTATATALAAFGGDLAVEQDESSTEQKIDVSMTATTDATGIDAGAGADTVVNSGLVSGLATSASGGSADALDATVQKSTKLDTKAVAESTSVGVAAGDGDDQVTNTGAIAATSTSVSGALAVSVVADQTNETPPPGEPTSTEKTQIELEASATSTATATGVATDADSVEDSSEETSPFGLDGLTVTYSKTLTAVSGDDTLLNSALISALATSLSGAGAAAISEQVNGTVAATAKAEATALATGLSTGGGADAITNTALLDAIATAVADALSFSLEVGSTSAGEGDASPPDKDNKASSDTSVAATATATGIDAEGAGQIQTLTRSAGIEDGGLAIDWSTQIDSLAGDDVVDNQGVVAVAATASSGTVNAAVAVSGGGSTSAKSESTAKATSTGIYTGGGNDDVTNSVDVTSTATADARALSLALGIGQGAETSADGTTAASTPPALAGKTETRTTAEARALGIDAEGEAQNTTSTGHLAIGADGITFTSSASATSQAGNDTVLNEGVLTALATATSQSVDATLDIDAVGSLDADAASEATATSKAIATGAGDDTVENGGLVTSTASAEAASLALALSVQQPSETTDDGETPPTEKPEKSNVKVDASATASATAFGIDAEGEQHDTSRTLSLEIPGSGLTASIEDSATALAGADTVTNDGAVVSTAIATSRAASAGLAIDAQGSAEVAADSAADAKAVGVFTGGGADSVTNNGALTADAAAAAGALSLALTVTQPEESDTPTDPSYLEQLKDKYAAADSKANAVANATALGIDAEGAAHETATAATLAIDGDGLRLSSTVHESSLAGDDVVTNSGLLTVTGTAASGAVAADIQVETEGTAFSQTNATATTRGTGVATGGGDDTVTNEGGIVVEAASGAGALSVTFTQKDGAGAPSKSDANATSEARAIGIEANGGFASIDTGLDIEIGSGGVSVEYDRTAIGAADDDTVTNSGAIAVNAVAGSDAGGVAIGIDGAASAEVKSTATTQAAGITTGGGADTIGNAGLLGSTASSTAGALAVGFAQNTSETRKETLEASVEAKATASATADGIVADGGLAEDTLTSHLNISADGLDAGVTRTELAFASADTIDNDGGIVTAATALAASAGGAVAIDGASSADVTSNATATAGGLDAGGGDDTIANRGGIESFAGATSYALSLGFAQQSNENTETKADVKASATATTDAAGIRGDSGADRTTDVSLTIGGDGLHASYQVDTQAVAGADTVDNSGAVSANALALSGALGAAIAIDGQAKADIESNATARAAGIETGGGADEVSNGGVVVATADSAAVAVAAAVGAKTGETSSAGAKVSAESKATATATGIATDGGVGDSHTLATLDIDASGLTASYTRTSNAASGDDTLENFASVGSLATAASGTESVALTIKGAANASASSEAKATAHALDAGGGADSVDNDGALDAIAIATANTLSASISTKGSAIANGGLLSGGTSADAKAVGLTSAGDVHAESLNVDGTIDFDDVGVTVSYASVEDGLLDGADTIENSGDIFASSTAEAAQLEAGITGEGVAVAIGRAESEAYAGAIDAGNGDDSIVNDATLDAVATSIAALGNVAVTGKGLAVAANAAWDGGTTATASAVGINADSGEKVTKTLDVEANADRAQLVYQATTETASGNDTIDNRGDVTTDALAVAPSLSVAVSAKGVAAAVSTSTAKAESTALRGGDGDDTIDNSGVLSSTAEANAATANVAVTNSGVAAAADAVWNGGTTAEAVATGIAGDGGARVKTTRIAIGTDETSIESDEVVELVSGADTIDNTNTVSADATARALSASVGVAVSGVGAATATSNAKARAAAIDAGAGEEVDDVTNSGDLFATATAEAAAASVSVTNEGAALSTGSVWDGGTKATTVARGIDVGVGGETIGNTGDIEVAADATTFSASVGVAVTGVAGASATATGSADAVAIDAASGADSDTVVNDGALSASASALAASASVAVTNAGLAIAADAVWDGGTGADARARGIDVGEAADTVTNRGAIDVAADSIAASAAVSVAVSGVAGATATSTSTADAAAIDAGTGDDAVENSAALAASADATAATSSVSVTTAGVAVAADSVWDAGTTADAKARGIDAGAGVDVLDNSGDMTVSAEGRALSAAVSVALSGVAGAINKSTATTDARAIDAGADDDEVVNSGDLDTFAISNAASAAVSFTAAGVAASGGSVWDGGTRGEATARAIDLGDGADTLVNDGELGASAEAYATGISVSVAVEGVAGAITAANADADAAAIDTGAGDDAVTNSGALAATSFADANTVSVAGTKFGVSVAGNNAWDGGTHGEATATGIRTGAGVDTIDNEGAIESSANVVAPSVSVAFTVGGVSAAVSTASADALSAAIDGGEDADTIENRGALDSQADATAVAVNVSIAGVGAAVAADAVWDGGTTSLARARGIDGGAGDDTIHNTGEGATVDTAADAVADSASISITAAGFAGSVSTSTATADARGIDGGAGDDDATNESALTSRADASATSVSVSVVGAGGALASDAFWDGGTKANAFAAGMTSGDGDDAFVNLGAIESDAASSTLSVAVAAAAGGGLAGAVVASTSTADAVGMTGDEGADTTTNAGSIDADALAEAEGVSVAFTSFGAAIAGAGVDAATRANGSAEGISGGGGDDTVVNDVDATIDVGATARTRETAVALALQGFAAAETNSIATGRSVGLDGGDGADLVSNAGSVVATADADGKARSIALTLFGEGEATANAVGDAGTTGLAGGAGDDTVENLGSVDLTSTARATGQSFGAGMVGVTFSDANATASSSATGADGGDGADILTNAGSLGVEAGAVTTARSISASLAGYAVGSANSTAAIDATGLQGSTGDDSLLNTTSGVVDVLATADVVASSISVTVLGAADGDARTTAVIAAKGLDGGSGDDGVVNEGAVTVNGRSKSFASSASFTVGGSSSARAGTEAETTLVGIDGGDGLDVLINRGTLEVGPAADATGDARWMSILDARANSSFGFAGSTTAESAATATTHSTGMAGGADADTIDNEGDVTVTASALNRSSSSTFGIFGSGSAGGQSGAETFGVGLDGGSGDDTIDNSGGLTLNAIARLELSGTSYTFGGSGGGSNTLAALTRADGIAGGDGVDTITNESRIDVNATASLVSTGEFEATFGSSSGQTQSGGEALAFGLSGGNDDDRLENAASGRIDVVASTDVSTQSVSYTFGGGSGTDAMLEGTASAAGFGGGDGADTLVNAGVLNVDASASLTGSGGAESSIGGSSATGRSIARADAAGFSGDGGNDVIATSGDVEVRATSVAEAKGSSDSTVFYGKAETGAYTQSFAEAAGLRGGEGVDTLTQSGTLDVTASSTAYALAYASGASFSFNGDGYTTANSEAVALALGFDAEAGDNTIVNSGDVQVLADATTAKDLNTTITVYRLAGAGGEDETPIDPPQTIEDDALPDFDDDDTGAQNKLDYPEGTIVFWSQSPVDDPNAAAPGAYYEVVVTLVDDDDDPDTDPVEVWTWAQTTGVTADTVVINQGSFPSYSAANGNGLDGDGTGYATGSAVAGAYGARLGDGVDIVENTGTLEVTARAEAVFNTAADGDAFGDANATSSATGRAHAWGLALGDGDNVVTNTGEILVTANPSAQARSAASGGDICIWFFGWWCGGGGDGYGYAYATLDAQAFGVTTGDGDNLIMNDGLIRVTAQPVIRVDPRDNTAYVVRVSEGAVTTSVTATSLAVGIATGTGSDHVVNRGEIDVDAYGLPGYTTSLAASGIVTGEGADVVENFGTVSALTWVGDVATAGTGIDTGVGDDSLVLGDGSSVVGSVDLGDGDDTLTLMGTPTIADAAGTRLVPQGNAGDDLLVLDGAGAFAVTPASFEHARKTGLGTYTLPSLVPVETLVIDQGVLALASDYAFLPTSTYATYFEIEGDSGRLDIAGAGALDGAIDVERRGSGYVSDGSRYTVLAATDGVGGAFVDVTLPASSALLSFDLEQSADRIDVVADAASFDTVASTKLYREIARNLDTIASDATGDLDDVFGTLQSLTDGFDEAFATLSPDAHFAGDHATRESNMEVFRLLAQHLQSTRDLYRDRVPQSLAYGDVSVAFDRGGFAAIGFSSNPNVGMWDENRIARNMTPIATATGESRRVAPSESNAQTWALGVLGQGDWDNVDGYSQFDTDSSAIALGRDYRVRDDLVLGASLGRTQIDADLDDIGADTSIDGWYGSLYGTWFSDRAYVEGGLSYAAQSFDTTRPVTVDGIARLAKSDYDGDTWMAFLGTGYAFSWNSVYAEPYATLFYFDTTTDSFDERGADGLDLLVDNRDSSALLGEAGVRLGVMQTLERGAIDWSATLALDHDFDVDSSELRYAYAGAPGAFFTLDARDVAADSALLGAGVTYLGRRSALALNYRGLFNSDYEDQSLGLRLSFRF